VENLVAALGEEFRFKIITTDRDLGDNLPYPGIVVNQWVRVGNADVMYLAPGFRGLLRMVGLLCYVDSETVLYLNSYFSRRFSMLAMLMRRLGLCRPRSVVLAPRGEFSPGALTLGRTKQTKKIWYITIFRWLGIYKNIIWHASTEVEATDIRQWFPRLWSMDVTPPSSNANDGSNITGVLATARDLAAARTPVERKTRRKNAGKLRVVFVSRISQKKNLLGALKILEGVSGEVTADIYGPMEDAAYWYACQRKITALPANIRVKYWGEIEHERVEQVFAEHDLFLLPTLGENYGHVILEALTEGCPVLISDQTPWRNLEEHGVGWDIPLDDTEKFRSVLQKCVDADDEWYNALSVRAITYADKFVSDSETIEANRRLFRFAAAMGPDNVG
jgi:glycosyltransferase involved in cell wall biosynthesis